MNQLPTWTDLRGAFCFAVAVLALLFAAYWLIRNVHSQGYWVYEIDADDGGLLYIGSCGDIKTRMHKHESYQRKLPEGHPRRWWWDAEWSVRANFEPSRKTWYASKAIALEVEKDRIRRKNPIANRIRYKGVGNVGGE